MDPTIWAEFSKTQGFRDFSVSFIAHQNLSLRPHPCPGGIDPPKLCCSWAVKDLHEKSILLEAGIAGAGTAGTAAAHRATPPAARGVLAEVPWGSSLGRGA